MHPPTELAASRLDSDHAAAPNSRMVETDGKSYASRRARCESDIVAMLRNIDGAAPIEALLGIYHVHYCPKRDGRSAKWNRMRIDRASEFLRRMEDAGLVRCTYDAQGIVIEARVR